MAALGTEGVIGLRPGGLYCPAGDFYIDPWTAVKRAVVTHAHADHARPGSESYRCAAPGAALLRRRMGGSAHIETLDYGESLTIGAARVSLHPAGHILGSAQVRIEAEGSVWVVSGDYNLTADPAAGAAFEPIRCDVFITESTFGLPIYHWPDPATVLSEIHDWWRRNRERGIVSVLPAYPLGKSQRLLAHLDAGEGPIAVQGNANHYLAAYRSAGIRQAPVLPLEESRLSELKGRALILTSSAAREEGILRRLEPLSWAFASGWMMTRGARRNRSFDRGFVLSDHADWDGLMTAIRATGASRIGVTHGPTDTFTRWLREQGWDAFAVPTRFVGETADSDAT